jgi:hypothetical protein
MSNLIREQRLDKNGVLNTKLVRAGKKDSGARTTFPAPVSPSFADRAAAGSFKALLEKERSHEVGVQDWREDADRELRALCAGMKQPKKLKCSDAEIFDVLEVVSEENVLPLLSAGVRSGKQAKKLLKANGLDRLLVDNSSQVKNLKYWEMHPRKAVMPPKERTAAKRDMYRSAEGYGTLSMRLPQSA